MPQTVKGSDHPKSWIETTRKMCSQLKVRSREGRPTEVLPTGKQKGCSQKPMIYINV